MSTVRIQVRRGTASQWTSANPTLAAGEIGLETDTSRLKFGDGSTAWTSLAYATTSSAALTNTLAEYVLLADIGQADGVASLDSSGKIPTSQLPDSLSFDAELTAAINALTTSDLEEGTNLYYTLERVQDAVAAQIETDSNLNAGYNDTTGKLTISTNSNITLSGALGANTVTADTINADVELNAGDVNITGNLTVSGTTTTVNTANFETSDALIYLGEGNNANVVDLGFVSSFNDGTYQHSGLVKDATDGVWKLFRGVTDEPTTTVNFSQASYETLQLGGLVATTASIGNVSNQEIQYLNGVTSNIQDQIDNSAATLQGNIDLKQDVVSGVSSLEISYLNGVTSSIQDQLADKANSSSPTISDPTFTVGSTTVSATEVSYLDGVTSGIQGQLDNKQAIVDGISNTEIGYLNGVTSSIQDQIDLKAPITDPTFTGTVVLPSSTSIGNLSSTEIGYLDGITSSVQTQIDSKLATSTASSTYAPIASPTFTGTVAGITKAMVGLGDADNTSDANKPISTATQTALDLKAPLANPTFTGTVSGVTKSMVGLANADNTSDANKPISTATQTALDLKANIAGPTFTGTATTADLVVNGDFTINGTNFSASATSITIEDNIVQLAHQNAANTVDLGLVVAYNDGTAKHSGLVRDVSDSKWKLFKDVTTEPATTVDFTQGSLDDLAVAALSATTITPSSGVVFTDGTQTKVGVPSITTIIPKTASYTLSDLAERDALFTMDNASATTFSVPTNASLAFPIGGSLDIAQIGNGQVTIAAVTPATTTILATPGNKLRTKASSATITKIATDTWLLSGDLTA